VAADSLAQGVSDQPDLKIALRARATTIDVGHRLMASNDLLGRAGGRACHRQQLAILQPEWARPLSSMDRLDHAL
jgi:hypothetical protein